MPRFVSSTVETASARSHPVLDGSDVTVPNGWKLPPHTVAIIGRPAVWTALRISLPAFAIGPWRLAPREVRWEQDFGGHLYLAVTGADATRASIVEAGPLNPNGTGNLVPFAYPEDDFTKRGVFDFDPIAIEPPHGLSREAFVDLVRGTQRAYDGDQRYLVIEIPFFRVGRDSNSYAIGVLLACGIDPRAVPKPKTEMRYEWTGYPGAEDPVHRANFGAYLGAPTRLGDGVLEVAFHNADGSVRLVLVGGAPNGTARLPDGTDVTLDALGRIAFTPSAAHERGLPSRHTEPPEQIAARRMFPKDPAPQGAQITLVVAGRSVPLAPGTTYRGTVTERYDALGLAVLETCDGEVILPLAELGVELRDPKRVDALARVGMEVTLGLHRDRHPHLEAHGGAWAADRFTWHRFHAPRPPDVARGLAATVAAAAALGAIGFLMLRAREER